MAKQQAEQETLGEAMDKTELFFEKNGRKLSYIFIALLILAGIIYGYRALIMQPREVRAAEMIAGAQNRFDAATPDFALALEGDAEAAGFLAVIDEYGSTASGNLAKHYAGICYLRMGQFENAAKYLAMYSPVDGIPGALVNAQNLGLQGDAAVELQKYAEAVKFYKAAVAAAENNLTAPLYLRKAALAEKAQGNKAAAVELLQSVIDNYGGTRDAHDAEKMLGEVNE